jgi:hypothetical protein
LDLFMGFTVHQSLPIIGLIRIRFLCADAEEALSYLG